MSARHHRLDIYGTHLYLATNRRDWSTLRRKLSFIDKVPDCAGMASFAVWVPKDGSVTETHLVIWIDKAAHRDPLDLLETAAHEATHGVAQLLEYVGHDHRGSDEPSAYFVGWLTRWIVEGCAP